MGLFVDLRKALSPSWLLQRFGLAWSTAHGTREDALAADAKSATKASFPSSAPSDALPLLGDDLVIERGPSETEDSYRARLLLALDAWRWSGTDYGIRTYALIPAGVGTPEIVRNRDWVPAPPDGDTARWSRAWLALKDTPWAADGDWEDSVAQGIAVFFSGGPGDYFGLNVGDHVGGVVECATPWNTDNTTTLAALVAAITGSVTWATVTSAIWGQIVLTATVPGAAGTFGVGTALDSTVTFTFNPNYPAASDPDPWDGDPTETWDTTATVDEVQHVRRLLRAWSPAHVRWMGVFVTFDTSFVWGDFTWGDGSTWGDEDSTVLWDWRDE